jgi:dihydrofolate reductase
MSELTITTFVSVDGVMQAPGGPTEDTSEGFVHGGWLVPFADSVFGECMTGVFEKAGAFLLGRRTYEIFAGHWPRVDVTQSLVAAKLNALPKYVASRTLRSVEWNASSLLGRDVVAEIRKLKAAPGKELQVHGSCGLAQTLIQHDLIDEYRLVQFPCVLGSGRRLWNAGAMPGTLALVDSKVTTTGAVITTYRRAGELKLGSFQLPSP